MKYVIYLIVISVLLSCGNEKIIQLPEINHSKITEISDVSVAYLFYDETQKDSVLLNRKNLISTTNWLVNIDKRLTLKQVIPQIQFLQEKKKNAGHKNENAKNYFTCHDASKNNLGFMEFTDVTYEINIANNTLNGLSTTSEIALINFNSFDKIQMDYMFHEHDEVFHFNFNELLIFLNERKEITIKLLFNSNLSFQDYITIKSKLFELNLDNIIISKTEFMY